MDDETVDTTADEERVQRRSELLPEEVAVGSEAPDEQAAAILEDSDARVASCDAAPDARAEHRTSEDTAPPA